MQTTENKYSNLQSQQILPSGEEQQNLNHNHPRVNTYSKIWMVVLIILLFSIVGRKHLYQQEKKEESDRVYQQDEGELESIGQLMDGEQVEAGMSYLMDKYGASSESQAMGFALYQRDRIAQQLQYAFYSKKFQFINSPELPICIVASEKNNMPDNRQKLFLNSVLTLNYTHFTLVLIDDASTDNTTSFTHAYLTNLPKQLQTKIQFVTNSQSMYSLANKVRGIIQFCPKNSIIVDVDADDYFIGRESLHIINSVYQNQITWVFYANYLYEDHNVLRTGSNRALSGEQIRSYRSSEEWAVSHLKTYRRELFMKLDLRQFRNSEGQFYEWAADRFILYGLIQLAGEQHLKFSNEFLYFYNSETNPFRNFDLIRPFKILSQLITPYKNLESLEENSVKIEGYVCPEQLVTRFKQAVEKYKRLGGDESKIIEKINI